MARLPRLGYAEHARRSPVDKPGQLHYFMVEIRQFCADPDETPTEDPLVDTKGPFGEYHASKVARQLESEEWFDATKLYTSIRRATPAEQERMQAEGRRPDGPKRRYVSGSR